MEKKNIFARFSLKWALGAMLIAGALVTGCKDDDGLQKQIDELQRIIDEIRANPNTISSVAPIEGGYRITFSDGKSVDVVNDGVGVQDMGDYYMLNYPGGSLYLPKVLTAVSSVVFMPTRLDPGGSGKEIIPFRSLNLTGVAAGPGEYDYSGVTELKYRINPSHVKKSSFEVVALRSSLLTLADKPMDIKIIDTLFEEGILTVWASYDKEGVASPATPGELDLDQQDRLQLVLKNVGSGDEVVSENIPVVRRVSLEVDSALVYGPRASWTTGTDHGALLFAMDGTTSIDFEDPGTMGSPTSLTGMADYSAVSRKVGGDPADAEDFTISTRDQTTVDKKYIASYDLRKQVGVFDYDGSANWSIPMEQDDFEPVYHFDTLKMNNADVDAFASISPAGVITFNSAFSATNMAYTPGFKVWATVKDGRGELEDATIAWGAVKLVLSDEAPTLEYEEILAPYTIKTWDYDTIWVGSLDAMLEEVGLSKATFAANYEIDAVSSFANKATLAPVKTMKGGSTGDAFDVIVEKGAFGVIVDKDAAVFNKYVIEISFVDKNAAAADIDYGQIDVALELNVKLPSLDGVWTKTNYLWYDNEVVVDGEPNDTDEWGMFAGLKGIWTGESYTNTLRVWPVAAAGDSAWVWRAMDGTRLIGDTITWTHDTIIYANTFSKHKDYINRSKGLKVAAYTKLLNHGGYAYDGITKKIGARGTGADSVLQLFSPVDLVFGMPVAPLQASSVAIELKGVQEGDEVYILNGLTLNNWLFGRQFGDKQIIKPSDDPKTKQAILDTVAFVQYNVAGATDPAPGTFDLSGISYEIPAELSSKLSIDEEGLLKWKGGINVTADETVKVTVIVPNRWNSGSVGNADTKKAVKVEVPVTIKTVRQ